MSKLAPSRAFYLAVLLLACPIFSCGPGQAKVAADGACTLLKAFGGTAQEQAICATAAELVAIADAIRLERSDAGSSARKGLPPAIDAGAGSGSSVTCQVVPRSTVCATDEELARAIRALPKR